MDRIEANRYLKKIDVNTAIDVFFEEFEHPDNLQYLEIKQALIRQIETYLKSDNNDFYHCDCRNSSAVLQVIFEWTRCKYSYDTVESEFALHRAFVSRIKKYHPRGRVFKSFMSGLKERFPECDEYKDHIRKRFSSHKAIREVIRSLSSDACSSFTFKRVLEIMSESDLLADKASEIQDILDKHKALCSDVLHSIPDDYTELYPKARRMHRHFHIIVAPTNAGKTWNALQHLKDASDGVYLAPLRLLAYEQFDRLNQDNVPCSLLTGEEKIEVPFSRVQSSTIEMLDFSKNYDIAVVDECQMLSDPCRGGAWTSAILGLCADEIYVCTAPEAEDLIVKMVGACHDTYDITHLERKTPLIMEDTRFRFPDDVKKGDALIVFSRQNVYFAAAALKDSGLKLSLIYGALPYDVRHEQAEKFSSGETDVVIATDAIGMGMNLPVRRVVFLEQDKFDGKATRPLRPSEVKQIGGRAGRFGVYDTGFVNTSAQRTLIRAALEYPNPIITNAVIGFPDPLLNVDGKLSEIMSQWDNMATKSGFIKANLQTEISLCRAIEDKSPSKEMTFRFVMIPFDDTKDDLFHMWKSMFDAEVKQSMYDVESELFYIGHIDNKDTAVLEHSYKRLDLLYHYCDKFDHREYLPELMRLKTETSQKIAGILSKQSFKGRTCAYCGRPLPWGYRYRLCDNCYDGWY